MATDYEDYKRRIKVKRINSPAEMKVSLMRNEQLIEELNDDNQINENNFDFVVHDIYTFEYEDDDDYFKFNSRINNYN